MSQDPVVSLIITFLTTPQTDFYLPKMLAKSQDPSLEPYRTARIDLGSHEVVGMSMQFALTNVVITGITNVQIKKINGQPDIQVAGDQVTFTAVRPNTEAPPPGVPKVITFNADFEVIPSGSPALTGTASVTVEQANIVGVFDATSTDGTPNTAVITFRSMEVTAPPDAGNIKVNVEIQSAFKAFINQIVNSPQMLQKISSEINAQLRTISVLNALSKAGTDAARAAAKQMPV